MRSGWPCFLVSLFFIGVVTYFVGEMANLFGCAVGLSNEMTALVFVALGTSLPDTFASRQAAQQMDDADAAIGNITGALLPMDSSARISKCAHLLLNLLTC
jgi:solute carrier family 8 (sodium/calcium exchanger)